MSNKVTKIKFLSIARDLKEHPNDSQKAVASRHRVSQATVSKVNQTRVWGNFQTNTDAKVTIQQTARTLQARIERARAAGLNPVPRKAQKSLSTELKTLEQYPTREEMQTEIRTLHTRIDILSDVQRGLERDPLFRFLFGRKVAQIIRSRDESREEVA